MLDWHPIGVSDHGWDAMSTVDFAHGIRFAERTSGAEGTLVETDALPPAVASVGPEHRRDRGARATRPGDLHERVLADVGSAIVSGRFPAGHVLVMEQLTEAHRVSRTVIRGVVRVLESMSLVATRRRVGVTVLPRSQWNAFDPRIIRWKLEGNDRSSALKALNELRLGVEPVAASLAAKLATPSHCSSLVQAVMGMSAAAKAVDLDTYLVHDVALHRTLLLASSNEFFAALADVVEEVLAGRTRFHLVPSVPDPEAVRLHVDVADAVQSGDADRAASCMTRILVGSTHALAAFEGETPPAPVVAVQGH